MRPAYGWCLSPPQNFRSAALPSTSRTCDRFRLSNLSSPALLAARGGGSYAQIHDLRWQNCLISDPHRPARAGGCDPLTTAWIKLAVACAPAKNSRGLLTVTSFCFCRSTVSGFCGASHCCQHLAHFHSTLLPASRGCRFQHCTRLTPHTASGKLAALCSSPWPHDQGRFHFAVSLPPSQSDLLPKQPTTLRHRPRRTERPAPLSSRCLRPFSD